jgi:hypothetical protein
MPTRGEIQEDIIRRKGTAQDEVRRAYLRQLADHTGRDTILYASAFTSRGSDVPPLALSVTLDDVQGFMAALHGLKHHELDLILHSPGGSMEAADQIVQYLRSKYRHSLRVSVPPGHLPSDAVRANDRESQWQRNLHDRADRGGGGPCSWPGWLTTACSGGGRAGGGSFCGRGGGAGWT